MSSPPDETTKTITVSTLNETVTPLYEGNETLSVVLSNATHGGTLSDNTGTGTILDDEDIPHFTIIPPSVIDEAAGSLTVFVQGNGASSVPLTVDYATGASGDTATAGSDYTTRSGTLHFNNQNLRTISVPVTEDAVFEGDEAFTVSISNASHNSPIKRADGDIAVGNTGTVTATIDDSADTPRFSIDSVAASEGSDLSFTVTRTGATVFSHSVDVATADITATVADNDYSASSATLTFATTESTKTITVSTTADTTVEPDETLSVSLSNATLGAALTDADGIGTLSNDDVVPKAPDHIKVRTSGSYGQNHTVSRTGSVSWLTGTTPPSYELERAVDDGGYNQLYSGSVSSPGQTQTYTQTYNNLADGVYRYRARFCNVSGCGPWRYSSLYSVASLPSDPDRLYTMADDPAGYTAGFTPGEFSVDAGGGANYQIPIAVPPGSAGMQPALSLSYNHRNGNALLGIGWTLGGLSVITRCPATQAQDSLIDGIDFDASDRFCIDGQRLVAVKGNYGANGTEYRTEVESFTRVISYGTAGTGPQYFTAETKSGQLLYYGWDDSNRHSRSQAQGKSDVRLWAVDRIEDSAGNYLTVSYTKTTTEYRPDRIDYTGNTGASTSPYASVRFTYTTRPDNIALYLAGSKVEVTRRLAHIKTYVGETLVRDYRLSYDNKGKVGASRLTQVQECAAGDACFAPTRFAWAGDGSPLDVDQHLVTHKTTDAFSSSGLYNYNFITGDWNGDGRTDIFLQNQGTTGTSVMYTATADGTMSATGFNPTDWWDGDGDNSRTLRILFTGDWNGDGKTDIAMETINIRRGGRPPRHTFTHTVTLYHSNGSRFDSNGYSLSHSHTGTKTEVFPITQVGDWNGDGRTDLFISKRGSTPNQMYTANSSGHMVATSYTSTWDNNLFALKSGDYNGDGQTDLLRCHRQTGSADVYLSTGTGFASAVSVATSGWHQYDLVPGDYNGDGNTDLFLQTTQAAPAESRLYFSKGDGSFIDSGYRSADWGTPSSSGAKKIVATPGDWNGDGKTDLMRTGGDLYLGDGATLRPVGVVANFYTKIVVGDWNGDGLSDVWVDVIKSVTDKQYTTGHSGFDVIAKITNGLGSDTEITYTPLTDSSVYTAGTSATYPERDIQAAAYVVSATLTDNGLGYHQDENKTTYTYSGARGDLKGRGFLGFATMTATDIATNTSTKTTYLQSHPYTGLTSVTEQRAGSTLINKVSNTYSSLTPYTGVSFVYASVVTEQDYELDASLVTTTTTTTTYGNETASKSYGNPLTIKVAVSDGTQTWTTWTKNTYSNDTEDWFLGRLTRAEVTQYLPGNTDDKDGTCTAAATGAVSTCATRTSTFTYSSSTGLLTQEVIEPDTAALKLTTDYTHDSFGNRQTVTTSGSDIISRTTTTTYDTQGRFPTRVQNPLGHAETREYDAQHGVMTKQTGPNGLSTQWDYDAFGRRISEHRADGTHSSIERAFCTRATCPWSDAIKVVGAFKTVTRHTGAPDTVVTSDRLGRELRSATIGLNRAIIETSGNVYNTKGQLDSRLRPHFTGARLCKNNTWRCWQAFTYDAMGRPLSEKASGPDGGLRITASTAYAGLTTTVTRRNITYSGNQVSYGANQVFKRIHNARGELIKTVDDADVETEYSYDPFGNLVKVIADARGSAVTTTNTYDLRGRKTAMTDPDMGSWTYEYNVLGELVKQTNAKDKAANTGPTVTMSYDLLGRMVHRTESEGTGSWFYDTATHGIGKLAKTTGAEGDTVTYTYDTLGRPATTHTWIDSDDDDIEDPGEGYDTTRRYNALGRLSHITYPASTNYPTGLVVRYQYTLDGYLKAVRNDADDSLYWQAEAQSAEGQLTEYTLGNGITTRRKYNAWDGRIDTIDSWTTLGSALSPNVQDEQYHFNLLGNLLRRDNTRQSVHETFTYDDVNRLTSTSFNDGTNPAVVTTYRYNATGNLTFKSDVHTGNYLYGTASSTCADAGAHAVTEVAGQCYLYDGNGNQTQGYNHIQGLVRTQTWTSYNKPSQVRQGTTTLSFKYGIGRARFQQHNSATNTTTHYIGNLYEKETTGSGSTASTTHIHYIRAAGETVAIYKSESNLTETLHYLHRDHIGSVVAITDGSQAIVETLSYDPWGKRRQANWTQVLNSLGQQTLLATVQTTRRGFTGHEMLDDVGLVHMNGRVYDPHIGRFLSADPFIQQPDNVQSFNRYSYVLNNPLKYIDASGFFFNPFKAIGKLFKGVVKFFKKAFKAILRSSFLRTVVAIGIAFLPGGGSLAAAFLKGFGAGFVASGGDLKSGIIGALTFGVSHGIGTHFGNLARAAGGALNTAQRVAKSLAHGVIGGVSSVAHGGKFLSGFLSAGTAQGFSQFGGYGAIGVSADPSSVGDYAYNTVASAVVGGTVAVLGGGKFGNGAKTFAFMQMFTEAADYYKKAVGRKANPLPGENRPGQTRYRPDQNGQQLPADQSMGVIGLNREMDGSWLDFFTQGGPLSKVLNIAPTMNATAALHDYWFNKPNHLDFTTWNVPTMLPAATISVGASIGNLTQGWQSNPMSLYLLTQPYDRDRR